MAAGGAVPGAGIAALEEELERQLRGYASDTKFVPDYHVEPMKKELETVLVVENLPKVGRDRLGKLLAFVTKIYNNLDPSRPSLVENGIDMPFNEEAGTTEGFAFIEFVTRADAERALAATNNWPFDASHTLHVYHYEAAKELLSTPDAYVPPRPHVLTVGSEPLSWLMDPAARDQFLITWHNQLREPRNEVLWSDARSAPALQFAGGEYGTRALEAWTSALSLRWSPQGTYLASLHAPGVRLWSGRDFEYGIGFKHDGVRAVHWSPSEKYLLTWSGYANNERPDGAAQVWDAATGALVRSFRQRRIADSACDLAWSSCGRFLARLEYDAAVTKSELLKIFDAETGFALHDRRSAKVPGACEVSWCPVGAPLLAWWSAERENAPASVQLMRMPSREVVKTRNLFGVDLLQLAWHPDGTHLAVLAAKAARGGRGRAAGAAGGAGGAGGALGDSEPLSVPSLLDADGKRPVLGLHGWTVEVIRLREKDMPTASLEVRGFVRSLAWEPTGQRFAIVSDAAGGTYDITFYRSQERGVVQVHELKATPYSSVSWCPRGDVVLLLGASTLEFFDVERTRRLNSGEHVGYKEAQWDPSGRAVALVRSSGASAAPGDMSHNCYDLYTFQGVRYFSAAKPNRLFSFAWRPRPAPLLSEEEQKAVQKNLKHYIAAFKAADARRENRKQHIARLERYETRMIFRSRLAEAGDFRRDAYFARGEQPPASDTVTIEQQFERTLEETVEEL